MRALCLFVAAACVPPIPSIEGKACDDAHPCGEGYRCQASSCGTRGTQLLTNGDFEAGLSASGWNDSGNAVIDAQQARVKSGAWAGRCAVQSQTSSSYFGINGDRAQGIVAGRTYCAEAWVDRGNVPEPNRLRMYLRTYDASDNWDDAVTLFAPVDAGWQRLTGSVVLAPPHDVGLIVRFSADSLPMGEYFIDDVAIWEDGPGGACTAEP